MAIKSQGSKFKNVFIRLSSWHLRQRNVIFSCSETLHEMVKVYKLILSEINSSMDISEKLTKMLCNPFHKLYTKIWLVPAHSYLSHQLPRPNSRRSACLTSDDEDHSLHLKQKWTAPWCWNAGCPLTTLASLTKAPAHSALGHREH